jgi:dTDP-4-dehydrorhamnose reductase
MRRVLITGGSGYLGGALVRSTPEGWQCHSTQRHRPVSGAIAHQCDLADLESVRSVWKSAQPDLVVHSAYSIQEGEADIWVATRNVVDVCLETGAELLHMSTDLVLDGERAPYAENAEPQPVHEYGRWKASAEAYVREGMPSAPVVRTSLITAFDPPDPRTAWVASGLRGEIPATLFVDEIRCPIFVDDLVRQIWEIVALPADQRGGVWHLAGPEALSRFALGSLIAAALGLPTVHLGRGLSRDSPVPRPRDLRLLTTRADRALSTRARPISVLAGEALAAAKKSG